MAEWSKALDLRSIVHLYAQVRTLSYAFYYFKQQLTKFTKSRDFTSVMIMHHVLHSAVAWLTKEDFYEAKCGGGGLIMPVDLKGILEP